MIFESVEKNIAYFFEKDGSVRRFFGRPFGAQFWPFVDDPDTLYIMDAGGKGVTREPLEVEAFTVVLASPNERHYGQFLKRVGLDALFFLPDWTLEDLQAVLPFVDDRVVNKVDRDSTVEKRYFYIGGLPRYIFASQDAFDGSVNNLKVALSQLTSFDFHKLLEKEQFAQEPEWNHTPNFVFSIRSQPPQYDDPSALVVVASSYALQQLPKSMNENHFRQLVAIASAKRDLSMAVFNTPADYGWQIACRYRLTLGGQVEWRAIGGTSDVPHATNPLPARKWGSLKYSGKQKDDIQIDHVQDDVLYWSEQGNIAEIEGFAIFLGNVVAMFQSTVREERSLNLTRINNVLKAISKHRNDIIRIQMWFLVPSRVYSTFSLTIPNTENLPKEVHFNEKRIPLDVIVATFPDRRQLNL